MTLVFWQGIISIHQKDFLEALAIQPGVDKVVLVVENDITPYRKSMGWEVPKLNNIELIVGPDKQMVNEICKMYVHAIHAFGGIRIGNMLSAAFDECIRIKAKIGVITETYNKAGFKGLLRSAKYFYNKLRYFKHINFVLGIGREAVALYQQLGFPPAYTLAWGYYINAAQEARPGVEQGTELTKIIYAGRLEDGKGLYLFIKQLKESGNTGFLLDVFGTGPDEQRIRQFVSDNNLQEKVRFYPFLKHDDLIAKYIEYNWVVLPSLQKDGWGVIVNEGLENGLKVICSNKCGASWAIKDGWNGVVFDWKKEGSCKHAIGQMLTGKTYADKDTIRGWADKTLSGKAGAAYFLKILAYVYENKEKPAIPWLRH